MTCNVTYERIPLQTDENRKKNFLFVNLIFHPSMVQIMHGRDDMKVNDADMKK